LTSHPRCDTIRVSRGSEVPPHRLGKAKKKNVKNLLTNPLEYDTIGVQSKGEGGTETIAGLGSTDIPKPPLFCMKI
jgi:hypothetical protein